MSLSERLGLDNARPTDKKRKLFETFGFFENPFPPASQPMGNPHKPTAADNAIEGRLSTFLRDKTTQVLVVEGTQGSGKTNLLEYYKDELSSMFDGDSRHHIIRYYPDPEAEFRGVVRRIVQDFGIEELEELGREFGKLIDDPTSRNDVLSVVRGRDTRVAFIALGKSANNPELLRETSSLLLEYLLGLRILKKHMEQLNVQFRLDTTEALTQGLHDLVYFGQKLGRLEAIFLFLDELEKQAGLYSTQIVVRYLSAIRALIDALPKNLFLVLAMTSDARRRYATMLPALAGRLQSPVALVPILELTEAIELCEFYLTFRRTEAAAEGTRCGWTQGTMDPVNRETVNRIFTALLVEADKSGLEGVTQRAFLDRLHNLAEKSIVTITQS